jgi:hypothetical protein
MPCSTKQISWDEARGKLDGFPVAVRESLDPLFRKNESKKVFVTSYPYGELIVENGHFKTPCEPSDCDECKSLVEATSYSPVPLACILSGSAEVFVDSPAHEEGQHLSPLKLLRRSELFGVFEILDYLLRSPGARAPWSVSSGARSIWIVAPLGDARLPQYLADITETDIDWTEVDPHWKLVADATRTRHPWASEVLIFPHSILKSVPRSNQFFTFLLELGWQQSSRLRMAATEDTELMKSANQVLRRVKVPQGELYHYRTIRHFQEMIDGVVPVFQSSNSNEEAGPFRAFSEELRKVSRSMKSAVAPFVLQPGHLEKDGDLGYYSFRCPSIPGPQLPSTTFAYSEIAEAYKDILVRLSRDKVKSFGVGEAQFFVRPAANAKTPPGLVSVKDLPPTDFYGAQVSNNREDVYVNSPFFVAGVRICKSQTRRIEPGKMNPIQAKAAGRGI